jgi:hypothetical protein
VKKKETGTHTERGSTAEGAREKISVSHKTSCTFLGWSYVFEFAVLKHHAERNKNRQKNLKTFFAPDMTGIKT